MIKHKGWWDEMEELRTRIAELESQLSDWSGLWRAIDDMEGGGLREDNKPLAIAASYALLKNRAEAAESQLAGARRDALEFLRPLAVEIKAMNERADRVINKSPAFEDLWQLLRRIQSAIDRALQAEPPAQGKEKP